MRAVLVSQDGRRGIGTAGIDGSAGTEGDADRQGMNSKHTRLQGNGIEEIGYVFPAFVQDCIRGDPGFGFTDLGPGTIDDGFDGIALGQALRLDFKVSTIQGFTVIDLLCGRRGQGDAGNGLDGQGAQVVTQDIVALVSIAPFDLIGVFGFADLGLFTGGDDLDGRIQLDGRKVRFVAGQDTGGVIGDLSIDGDADVGGIRHNTVLGGSGHIQAVDGNRSFLQRGQSGDQRGHEIRIPVRLLTGGGQQVRVFRIETQDFFRKLLFLQVLNDELHGFSGLAFLQGDGEALADLQLDAPGLLGERVGAVDEDTAGYSDHLLAAQGGLRDDGGVLPGGLLGIVTGDGADTGLTAGKRFAVIFLLSRAGPDGQRRAVHYQLAGNQADGREMRVDVLAGRIGDGLGRDDVFT